jgi:hypothetical protein
MAANGITMLTAVTQQKQDNANDNALSGAKKQSDLVKKEQQVHDQEQALEDMVQNKDLIDDDYWKINRMLGNDGLSIKGVDDGWDGILGNTKADGHWHATLDSTGGDNTEGKNYKLIQDIKDRFQKLDTDLSNQDKLGNFQVQSLMSDYNEAQTLASSVKKKSDDTDNAVIGKI